MYGGVYSSCRLGESKSGAKFPSRPTFLSSRGADLSMPRLFGIIGCSGGSSVLCRKAIKYFQQHKIWKCQYLAAFEFKRSAGFEAYEKLFGPKLIDPIEKFLDETPSVLTVKNTWAKPSDVVLVDETPDAIKALTDLGLLSPDDIAPVLGGNHISCLFIPK